MSDLYTHHLSDISETPEFQRIQIWTLHSLPQTRLSTDILSLFLVVQTFHLTSSYLPSPAGLYFVCTSFMYYSEIRRLRAFVLFLFLQDGEWKSSSSKTRHEEEISIQAGG